MLTSAGTLRGLSDDLADLGVGSSSNWVQIGYALDAADKAGTWRKSAQSFSIWLRRYAALLGLNETSLWRYMASVRFYTGYRTELSTRAIDLPELESLPSTVSAESLELLAKLCRVAPARSTDVLAQRLIAGVISRAELRLEWQGYRKALEGRTARGRGVSPPSVNLADEAVVKTVFEGEVLSALRNGGTDWLGTQYPDIFQVFLDVTIPSSRGGSKKGRTIDVAVVYRPTPDSPLELHGVEIRNTAPDFRDLSPFEEFALSFDAVWLVAPFDPAGAKKLLLPASLGILLPNQARLNILRPAKYNTVSDQHSGALAKVLLSRSLKH